jgi:hypothetical protein
MPSPVALLVYRRAPKRPVRSGARPSSGSAWPLSIVLVAHDRGVKSQTIQSITTRYRTERHPSSDFFGAPRAESS